MIPREQRRDSWKARVVLVTVVVNVIRAVQRLVPWTSWVIDSLVRRRRTNQSRIRTFACI